MWFIVLLLPVAACLYVQMPNSFFFMLFSHLYQQILLPTFGFLGPEISKADFKLTQPITYFLKLMQPLTFYTVHLLYTVKGRGGKSDRTPYPLSYGLRNPYRNLKSESSQDYAQKHQRNYTLVNSASVQCIHCKKRVTIFPSPDGMSLTKLSLAGNNLNIPGRPFFTL